MFDSAKTVYLQSPPRGFDAIQRRFVNQQDINSERPASFQPIRAEVVFGEPNHVSLESVRTFGLCGRSRQDSFISGCPSCHRNPQRVWMRQFEWVAKRYAYRTGGRAIACQAEREHGGKDRNRVNGEA